MDWSGRTDTKTMCRATLPGELSDLLGTRSLKKSCSETALEGAASRVCVEWHRNAVDASAAILHHRVFSVLPPIGDSHDFAMVSAHQLEERLLGRDCAVTRTDWLDASKRVPSATDAGQAKRMATDEPEPTETIGDFPDASTTNTAFSRPGCCLREKTKTEPALYGQSHTRICKAFWC